MIDTEKILDPDRLRNNLILASLYLSAYELLKTTIIDNILNFFSTDYINGKPVKSRQYQDEIIRVDKDLLRASCLWLVKVDVISQDEMEEIQAIRRHRNEIAHELPKLLLDSELNLKLDYFIRIRELLGKIELWWVRNFEIPTNPDFDGIEVDDSEIYPSRVIMLDYIISVVLADHQSEATEKPQVT